LHILALSIDATKIRYPNPSSKSQPILVPFPTKKTGKHPTLWLFKKGDAILGTVSE